MGDAQLVFVCFFYNGLVSHFFFKLRSLKEHLSKLFCFYAFQFAHKRNDVVILCRVLDILMTENRPATIFGLLTARGNTAIFFIFIREIDIKVPSMCH